MKSQMEISLDRANEAIRKLSSALDREREDKALLLQQIEREAEMRKPVVIPLHVADAIEFFRSSGIQDTIILGIMYGVYFENDGTHAYSLFNYRVSGGGINIANAIVNGYTVETVETKIKAAVRGVIKNWGEEPKKYDEEYAIDDLSSSIQIAVTRIIREDQAAVQ